MLTLVAFIIAIGVLIAVHEYGHYRVAVACGVKVQRFGIATFPVQEPDADSGPMHRFFHFIAKPVWEWQPKRQHPGQQTVFAIGLFPVAGYVQMLGQNADEAVKPDDAAWSFKNKDVKARFAIVAAGPIANLLLAILLYSAVNWYGVEEPKAVLSQPVAGSVAAQAGLQGGEFVERGAFDGEPLEQLRSFEQLRWLLTRGALDGRDVRLAVAGGREVTVRLAQLDASDANPQLFQKIGVLGPWLKPQIGEVVTGQPAQAAGLRTGDLVLAVDGKRIVDGQQLFQLIRASGSSGQAAPQVWRVDRAGRTVELTVQPIVVRDNGTPIGRIGARVSQPPEMVEVHYGFLEGLELGASRTWDMSVLTLRMLGKMVIGEASLKNLSGPITIADYAGKSASLGLTQYLLFLALISVSLGVLNLLPLPVLDGGHLMYYLWEVVTGRSVSDAWMERLQRGGVAVLMVMMSIALFNDVTRLFG